MRIILLVALLISVSCGRRPGKVGQPGRDGVDGYSLVVDVSTFTSGAVTCKRTDIFQDLDRNNYYSSGDAYNNGFFVCNGEKGEDGEQGIQGLPGINADTTYNIIAVVDPCNTQNSHGYDEVILKLGNGTYLSSFSDNANGLNTRFGILKPGNYVTTDGTSCRFTIHTNGTISW